MEKISSSFRMFPADIDSGQLIERETDPFYSPEGKNIFMNEFFLLAVIATNKFSIFLLGLA